MTYGINSDPTGHCYLVLKNGAQLTADSNSENSSRYGINRYIIMASGADTVMIAKGGLFVNNEVAPALSDGLSVTASTDYTGAGATTPDAWDGYSYKVGAVNAKYVAIKVPTASAPAISTPAGALSGGTVGTSYSATIAASNSPTSFAVSVGSLPAGLSIDSSGVISGTPSAAGTSTFSVTATNATGTSAAVEYTITIAAAIDTGDFTITGGTAGTDYTFNSTTRALNITGGGTYEIGMASTLTNPATDTGFTKDRILVAGGIAADITLIGVKIDSSATDSHTAFRLNGTAEVNLTLSGASTLKSGKNSAGLGVAEGAKLTIGGTGSLTATGGNSGAGIGSGSNGICGTVTINDGTVTATGGSSGAGIGGGSFGSGGKVTITGGTVVATGSDYSAGIGDGNSGSGGVIFIT